MRAVGGAPRAEGAAVTPEALNTLARDIAEAAAKCVGADNCDGRVATHRQGTSAAVQLIAEAADWRAEGHAVGAEGDALNAAAVLALRDRVVAQREVRARMLAADDAALRVIDETARVYDAATVTEAAGATGDRAVILRMWLDGEGPWSREDVSVAVTMAQHHSVGEVLDACDAILRRRAVAP